jgi:hypothetical protein
MRVFVVALAAASVFATQAAATDARVERQLKMLDLGVRLEQLCDYTAMANIKKDTREYRPDRALASARAEPQVKGNTIKAEGAAFRSRKKWYALSYSCTADAEHMKVLAFKYKIGAEIPESHWAAYNLFD